MTAARAAIYRFLLVGVLLAIAGPAQAICTINSGTASPATANTGTYTYPNPPTPQPVTFTVTGTYFALLGGTCTVAISINRGSLPASMARSGGGATLDYTVTSAAGGGNTLLYTGTVPATANIITASFVPGILGLDAPYTESFTIYFSMQPASSQLAGSYADNVATGIFNVSAGGTISSVGSSALTVNGTVSKVCTIGGLANPSMDSATIPITSGGAVDTSSINRTYANAACNTAATIQLTSQSGAVKAAGTPPTGFTNLINYSASATFSSATSMLDSATLPTAIGPESGSIGSTSGATPTGSLNLTITPQASAAPLIAGSYNDVLSIMITPQ